MTQRYLFRKMVDCVVYLNNVDKLAHLDIKPDNFLFLDDYSVALIDFGLSQNISIHSQQVCGTKAFRAPEIDALEDGWNSKYWTNTAETFGFGATMISLMSLNFPFDSNISFEDKYSDIYFGQ